jgi:hypothetical protein
MADKDQVLTLKLDASDLATLIEHEARIRALEAMREELIAMLGGLDPRLAERLDPRRLTAKEITT